MYLITCPEEIITTLIDYLGNDSIVFALGYKEWGIKALILGNAVRRDLGKYSSVTGLKVLREGKHDIIVHGYNMNGHCNYPQLHSPHYDIIVDSYISGLKRELTNLQIHELFQKIKEFDCEICGDKS